MRPKIQVNTLKFNLIGASALLFISFLAGWAFIGGGLKKNLHLRNEHQILSNQLAMNIGLSGIMEQAEQVLRSLDDKIAQLNQRLPGVMDEREFFLSLNNLADSNRIQIASLKPEISVAKEGFDEMPVKLHAIASFENFHNFLFSVTTMPRLTKIDKLSIEKTDEPGLYNFHMTIKIFSEHQTVVQDA